MELPSLQFNGNSWSVFRLGEKAWLLTPQVDSGSLAVIHQAANSLEKASIASLIDIVPAYNSLTLIFSRKNIDLTKELSHVNFASEIQDVQTHVVQVCYDLGLDWKELEAHSGMSKEEIITIHSSVDYTIAMMGFLPGFVFLEGLDERLFIPRKDNPRTKIPASSVGIGGSQTGIYSLESPGGWQVIGRTPQSFFDVRNEPPGKLKAGDKVVFESISKNEFIKLSGQNG